MPARVEAKDTDEHTRLVEARALGIESKSARSVLV
jgi:hypothetical protein